MENTQIIIGISATAIPILIFMIYLTYQIAMDN